MSLVFIDGRNQLHRCYHTGKMLTRADGFPTGAVYGCLSHSLLSIARRIPDASFVWVWDGVGETWRHRMMAQLPQIDSTQFPDNEEEEEQGSFNFNQSVNSSLEFLGVYKQPTRRKKPKTQGYKAQRQKRIVAAAKENKVRKSKWPTDDRTRAMIQMPILRLILHNLGFRQFEVEGLEADDLLAMLVMKAIELDSEQDIFVMSGDKDYYQLLKHPQVKILRGLQDGKLNLFTADKLETEYKFKVEDWTKFRALTGDTSDNIPHLMNVGKVRARKMVEYGFDPSNPDYHHVDSEARDVYARYFEPHGIKAMWPAIYGNWKLCEFVTDIDSELLSKDVKEKLFHIFNKITSIRKFKRRESFKTPENYRKVGFLLGQYELQSVLAQMELLWQIS